MSDMLINLIPNPQVNTNSTFDDQHYARAQSSNIKLYEGCSSIVENAQNTDADSPMPKKKTKNRRIRRVRNKGIPAAENNSQQSLKQDTKTQTNDVTTTNLSLMQNDIDTFSILSDPEITEDDQKLVQINFFLQQDHNSEIKAPFLINFIDDFDITLNNAKVYYAKNQRFVSVNDDEITKECKILMGKYKDLQQKYMCDVSYINIDLYKMDTNELFLPEYIVEDFIEISNLHNILMKKLNAGNAKQYKNAISSCKLVEKLVVEYQVLYLMTIAQHAYTENNINFINIYKQHICECTFKYLELSINEEFRTIDDFFKDLEKTKILGWLMSTDIIDKLDNNNKLSDIFEKNKSILSKSLDKIANYYNNNIGRHKKNFFEVMLITAAYILIDTNAAMSFLNKYEIFLGSTYHNLSNDELITKIDDKIDVSNFYHVLNYIDLFLNHKKTNIQSLNTSSISEIEISFIYISKGCELINKVSKISSKMLTLLFNKAYDKIISSSLDEMSFLLNMEGTDLDIFELDVLHTYFNVMDILKKNMDNALQNKKNNEVDITDITIKQKLQQLKECSSKIATPTADFKKLLDILNKLILKDIATYNEVTNFINLINAICEKCISYDIIKGEYPDFNKLANDLDQLKVELDNKFQTRLKKELPSDRKKNQTAKKQTPKANIRVMIDHHDPEKSTSRYYYDIEDKISQLKKDNQISDAENRYTEILNFYHKNPTQNLYKTNKMLDNFRASSDDLNVKCLTLYGKVDLSYSTANIRLHRVMRKFNSDMETLDIVENSLLNGLLLPITILYKFKTIMLYYFKNNTEIRNDIEKTLMYLDPLKKFIKDTPNNMILIDLNIQSLCADIEKMSDKAMYLDEMIDRLIDLYNLKMTVGQENRDELDKLIKLRNNKLGFDNEQKSVSTIRIEKFIYDLKEDSYNTKQRVIKLSISLTELSGDIYT